jgi:hypothetical protein
MTIAARRRSPSTSPAQSIGEFVEQYNNRRYHESLDKPDAGRRLLR